MLRFRSLKCLVTRLRSGRFRKDALPTRWSRLILNLYRLRLLRRYWIRKEHDLWRTVNASASASKALITACSFLIQYRRNNLRRYRFKMRRLHRVGSASFRKRPDRSRVTKHFSKRNLGMNDGREIFRFHIHDAATTPVQIAHEIALILLRGHALHLHDRFEKDGVCLLERVLHRENSSKLKRQFV